MPALATRLFSIYALSTLHVQALRGSTDEASSLERHTDLGMCTWWGSVCVYVHSPGGSGEAPEIMRLRSKEKGDEVKAWRESVWGGERAWRYKGAAWLIYVAEIILYHTGEI